MFHQVCIIFHQNIISYHSYSGIFGDNGQSWQRNFDAIDERAWHIPGKESAVNKPVQSTLIVWLNDNGPTLYRWYCLVPVCCPHYLWWQPSLLGVGKQGGWYDSSPKFERLLICFFFKLQAEENESQVPDGSDSESLASTVHQNLQCSSINRSQTNLALQRGMWPSVYKSQLSISIFLFSQLKTREIVPCVSYRIKFSAKQNEISHDHSCFNIQKSARSLFKKGCF